MCKKTWIAWLIGKKKTLPFGFQANEDQDDLDERHDPGSDIEMNDTKHANDTARYPTLFFPIILF